MLGLSAPAKADEFTFSGMGIIVLGGRDNEIAYNRVERHPNVGIGISLVVDANMWLPEGNRVHDNAVSGSGIADLALLAPAAAGNCFETNVAGTSLPPLLQEAYACGSPLSGLGGGDVALSLAGVARLVRATVLGSYPHGEPRDAPSAPPQPNMSDVNIPPAPAGPATRIDPQAEVRRAASLHKEVAVSVPGSLMNAVYLVLGYALPVLALGAVLFAIVARALRRRWPRRLVFMPLGAYVLFLVGVTVVELLHP